MKTLVLCGGAGTRLRAVLNGTPKPLAVVEGKPMLEWILISLRARGLSDVTLCTGYKSEAIENYFGDGNRLGMHLEYAREAQPLGTAGAVRAALPDGPSGTTLILNGDSYTPVDIHRLLAEHRMNGARVSLWLVPVDDRTAYGAVDLGSDGWIRAFREKTPEQTPGLISAGVYLIERPVIDEMPPDCPLSLENDILPRLGRQRVHGVVGGGPFVDIGTPDSYRLAGHIMKDEFARLAGQSSSDRGVEAWARNRLAQSAQTISLTADECTDQIIGAARVIGAAFQTGSKLLLCGNGGSAADCQHVAAEFVNLLRKDFPRRALPAIALTTDTSILTAVANDVGYESVFARQVEALGKPGDVLLVISTSGRSPSVLRALDAARRIGMTTIGLVGMGAARRTQVDFAIEVPNSDTQLVQEALLPIEHVLCETVERFFLEEWRSP